MNMTFELSVFFSLYYLLSFYFYFYFILFYILGLVMTMCFLSGAHTVAKLIGCDISDLKVALATRKMKVGKDIIVQKLTLSQVTFSCS